MPVSSGQRASTLNFFKTVSIAQGANIVRRDMGVPLSPVPAADPALQTDVVPKTSR